MVAGAGGDNAKMRKFFTILRLRKLAICLRKMVLSKIYP